MVVDRDTAQPRAWPDHAALAARVHAAPVIVAAAVVSAAMLWLSSRSGGLGWLAWVALVPVAVVVLSDRAGRPQRWAVPLTVGLYLELLIVPALPFGIAEGQWGGPPLPVLVGDSPVLLAAVVAVPALTVLLWALRFGQPWLRSGPTGAVVLGAILGPAMAWTAFDFVRVKLDPGGMWGPLFLSQRSSAGDLVALAGPWGLTFAVVATNYALASAVVGGSAARVAAATVIALLAGALLASAGRGGHERSLSLAAVQPGYNTIENDRPEPRHFPPGTRVLAEPGTIRDLARLTRAAADRGAELVVWPEAAVWTDPRRTPPVRVALERLADETAAAVVIPYFLPEHGHGGTITVEPRRGIGRAQPKQRPMWFIGESGGNKVAPRPVAAAGERIGTLLGVDNQDPDVAATLVRGGASVLASSTHDWAELAGAQRAFAEFHATAAAVPVIRADWRFGSAIYDAGGRLLADAGPARQRAIVVASARPALRPTTAVRIGDVPGWTAVVASIARLALGGAMRFRHRPPRASGRPRSRSDRVPTRLTRAA